MIETWALLGMLGCLGLGYVLGRASRQREIVEANRRKWDASYQFVWQGLGPQWWDKVVADVERHEEDTARAAAVERLLREL